MHTFHSGSMKIRKSMTTISCLAALTSQAEAQTYRSVSVDSAGQLLVTPSAGIRFKAPRLPDQVSFSQPSMSNDRLTLAWLANYRDPAAAPGSGNPIAGHLVLYRAGRVLRTYGTDQVFWSWRFANNGKDVAFCTGPLHGGADTCELHRISSGDLSATWSTRSAENPPDWVVGLEY